ncbi:hypothetical protein ACVGWD_00180, partial [Enterobacter asburiae]
PNIVLKDEPTDSLDEHTEREFIERLGDWIVHRTLIVATHRVPVLDLVERVVVLKVGMLPLSYTQLRPHDTLTSISYEFIFLKNSRLVLWAGRRVGVAGGG